MLMPRPYPHQLNSDDWMSWLMFSTEIIILIANSKLKAMDHT